MTRIQWNPTIARVDEGADRGVLYLSDGVVPWNGLVKVTENDSGTVNANKYEGRNVRMLETIGDFSAQVDSLYYPEEFESYAGFLYSDKQPRRRFGFSYRTGREGYYQIHMVWNARVMPILKSHATDQKTPAMETLSWTLQASPEDIPGAGPSAHLVVDTSLTRYPDAVTALEAILYGDATHAPRLPTPTEVVNLFESYVLFRVTYNNDGTWTATGPDAWITVNADGTYEITSPTAFQTGEYTHTLSSY